LSWWRLSTAPDYLVSLYIYWKWLCRDGDG
jgi:hypothetical protein